VSDYPFVSCTLARAVEATGISESTIKRAIASGDLPAHYVGSRAGKPVVRAVDLDEWVQSLPRTSGRKTTAA